MLKTRSKNPVFLFKLNENILKFTPSPELLQKKLKHHIILVCFIDISYYIYGVNVLP